jgi:hypothetical protein
LFLKKLASRLLSRPTPAAARAHVAAFGKHPGWNDHIDDLGLDTDLLVAAKRLIYVEGIGGNVDSGAWERLEEDQRLPGFDHLLVWHVGRDVLICRLWSSSDGKGRTRYPMVACAHVIDVALTWALSRIPPILERLHARCAATNSADAVRAAVAAAQGELAPLAADAPHQTDGEPDPSPLRRLGSSPDLGPDALGLIRVLYQIEREMGSYRLRTGTTGRTRSLDLRPQQLRVPPVADTQAAAAEAWFGLLATQLDPAAPVMVIVPAASPWLDVLVGEPTTQQFFCVRAARKSLPLTTEIPYNIDPEFVARTRPLLGG